MNGKHFLEPRPLKIEVVTVGLYKQRTFLDHHLMQHCVAEWKSFYMWPFHQHLLALEVHFPPFLACSLSFMLSFWVFLSFGGG